MVKHGGGSILVWGCVSANGFGGLVHNLGTKNAEKYQKILIHHAVPSGTRLHGEKFIFQHDNDPKRTGLMEWPPQSPDLNIIEQIWDHLDREKNEKQPKSLDELWTILQNAWKNILLMFYKNYKIAFPNASVQSYIQNIE
jgi:hypothetical protein